MADKDNGKKIAEAEEVKDKELALEDIEDVSGGAGSPFDKVPRVKEHDYDSTIKKKV